jgi:IS30 family transposase
VSISPDRYSSGRRKPFQFNAIRRGPDAITVGLTSGQAGDVRADAVDSSTSFEPTDRSQAGHREGDIIVGNNQGSMIGTLVERQIRLIRLLHLPARDAGSLHIAITTAFIGLPPTLIRSIT